MALVLTRLADSDIALLLLLLQLPLLLLLLLLLQQYDIKTRRFSE